MADQIEQQGSDGGRTGPQSETRQSATIRHVDRPDCKETFADSLTSLVFDGHTLRIELSVTTFDEVKPNSPLSARRYPACRLVLTPPAALDLANRLQQVVNALQQARAAAKP